MILSGGRVSACETGNSNKVENNLEPVDPENMEDDDNADERGMRARPQPREPSTQEVEAHVIDYCPFRSWCRSCVMAVKK